jgi:cytidylate kinase
MPIITISKRIYDRGDEIADKVGRELGYQNIGREIFAAASEEFGIPEDKLFEAVHDAPSLLGMSSVNRKRYISYAQAALASYMLQDNVVYHGPAGHLLVQGVSHVLRVRVLSNLEDRIALMMKREKKSEKEARKHILRDDEQRKKWVKLFYGKDDTDPHIYDLMIHVGQVPIDHAANIIVGTAKLRKFQPMTYSLKLMKNLELKYRVKAHLVDLDADVRVDSDGGHITAHTKAGGRNREKNIEIMKKRVLRLAGVKSVEVLVSEDLFERFAGEMR